jgi:hypothetical protein
VTLAVETLRGVSRDCLSVARVSSVDAVARVCVYMCARMNV